MLKSLVLSMIVSCVLSVSAMAESPMMGKAGLIAVEGDYTVTAIDHKTRTVTLKDSEGHEASYVIGKEARNLDQVEVGDIVTVKAAEGMAASVYPAGSGMQKGSIEKTDISRSDLGQKPHVSITSHIQLMGLIAKLDKENRMATIQGKEGSIDFQVADDVDLDKVKVGDRVVVDYVEMVSITVNAPKK